MLAILGLTGICSPFYYYRVSTYIKDDKDLTTLTAYLINHPKYLTSGSGKSSRKILRLQLDGYPGVSFDNDDVLLGITEYKSVLNDIKSHDTVTITVLKNDFENGYLQRESYSPSEKIFKTKDHFNFYSLIFKNRNYVDFSQIGESVNNRKIRLIISNGLFGGIFLICGILLLIKCYQSK